MKIAIIGSGIAGNSAAYLLNKKYDITLFEKNNYVGGHSNTANINYEGENINVDTGFIVFNHRTYPNLTKLFKKLNVETTKSDMSFGISCQKTGFEYCVRNIKGLFANKSNIFNLKFIKMLFDVVKFNKKATKFVLNNKNNRVIQTEKTLGDFLAEIKVSDYFLNYFLLPMAGAIWSCPAKQMLEYPALSFLRFYHNHGLLTLFNQPQWFSVKGGSKEYVKLLINDFKDKIKLNSKIKSVTKKDEEIEIIDENNQVYSFDKVIFANHPDEILQIAQNLPEESVKVLENFKFQENLAILHKDNSFMPKKKSAWASWVYFRESDVQDKCCVSYYMNFLQDINEKYPIFVTLNPHKEVKKEDIFAKYVYHHPIFDKNAIDAQGKISQIQGLNNFYYVGAYQENGFHEDGLVSALKVAKLFGVAEL